MSKKIVLLCLASVMVALLSFALTAAVFLLLDQYDQELYEEATQNLHLDENFMSRGYEKMKKILGFNTTSSARVPSFVVTEDGKINFE